MLAGTALQMCYTGTTPTLPPSTGTVDRFYDRMAPGMLAALALLGAYYGRAALVALATTLLFTLLLTRSWSRHSLRAVRYQRELSDDRAFPDDEVDLTLRLANDKLLPLPWVEVDDRVPGMLAPAGGGVTGETVDGDRLRLAGSASWKERILWRYRLHCARRGVYHLGPAVITSGDPFGFFPRSAELGGTTRLVVYPRLIPLDRLALPPGFPLGETRAERWIFQDPSRTVGVRDHRREDSFRRIHWKATARRQQLQVKLHEPTTTLQTALFLDVAGWGSGSVSLNPDLQPPTPNAHFEHAVSVAASIAHLLIGRRHPVGLYVNGGTAGSEGCIELPPGSSQEQLIRILELLAAVAPVVSDPIETLLARVGPRLPWGSSIVVVAGGVSEPLLAALQAVRRTGRRPTLLNVSDGPTPESRDGIGIYTVGTASTKKAGSRVAGDERSA